MAVRLVDRGQYRASASSDDVGENFRLSHPGDARPVDIIRLMPGEYCQFSTGYRHDLMVLDGLLEGLGEQSLPTGSYVSINLPDELTIRGGSTGATLFRYRELAGPVSHHIIIRPEDRIWHEGQNHGVQFCPLSAVAHDVSLVSFRPGTAIPAHDHVAGEEVFVLNGTLKDAHGDTQAGGWLRLYPAAKHAPFADGEVTFLLRNGHLAAV